MLIIDTRESESLDKALKKYKKKYEKAGIIKELRNRQSFTKKSVRRRTTVLKAIYKNNILLENEGYSLNFFACMGVFLICSRGFITIFL